MLMIFGFSKLWACVTSWVISTLDNLRGGPGRASKELFLGENLSGLPLVLGDWVSFIQCQLSILASI